jgi:hypothetical protein
METATRNLHTPGPWRAETPPVDAYTDPDINLDSDVAFWIADDRDAGEVLACINRTARGEQEANARLMAAAPALVTTLRSIHTIACYASEEHPESRAEMLLAIGDQARTALRQALGDDCETIAAPLPWTPLPSDKSDG